MQIRNSSTNFGSIKLSKNNTKSFKELTSDTLKDFQIILLGGDDISAIRGALNTKQAALIVDKKEFSIIGKNSQEETFIFQQVKETFDSNAKFIDDFETPTLDISG